VVVFVAAACKLGWGTLCSLGPGGQVYLCPLGFLQTALAGRGVSPQVWLPLALMLASIVVLGRYFCGWVCPATLLRLLFGGQAATSGGARNSSKARPAGAAVGVMAMAGAPEDGAAAGGLKALAGRWRAALDSRHLVLGGTLLSAAIFGFPVFCLICPVGLFFGTLFAVTRLFSIQQVSLELVLYPTLLGLELLVLKNWCRSFCPLGALLSLLSGLNPSFRPKIRSERCLTWKGVNCQACRRACPEAIDLREPEAGRSPMNCTKCRSCAESCPTKAIEFPIKD